jgi:hypothetical protein
MDAWHENEPYDWQQDAVVWEAGNLGVHDIAGVSEGEC